MSSPEAAATRQEAVSNIWMLNRTEEIHWRHKSRALKEGDKNTKFFHRKRVNYVRKRVDYVGRIRRDGRGQLKSEKVLLSSLRIFIKVTILSDPI